MGTLKPSAKCDEEYLMRESKPKKVRHTWRQSALLLLIMGSAALAAVGGVLAAPASYLALALSLGITTWALRVIGRLEKGGRALMAPSATSRTFNVWALAGVLLGQIYLFYAAGH